MLVARQSVITVAKTACDRHRQTSYDKGQTIQRKETVGSQRQSFCRIEITAMRSRRRVRWIMGVQLGAHAQSVDNC